MPSVEEIRSAALRALKAVGVSDRHAETQVSLLLEAELRGTASHGLLRLPRVIDRILSGASNPASEGIQSWRGNALLDVDGDHGLGPVVAMAALDAICGRAAETGVSAAAIRNCDHLGMLAWYAERVASHGQILIALTISEALVHPWGGRRAMLGTNPIAIGVPAEPHPFVFDMATSLVSMGKIHDHANRGIPIPSGWALDQDGNPTTDAVAAKDGAIAPFGGAKGYALGLAFELLVASLTGSAIGTEVRGTLDARYPCNKGDVFIVLEPAGGMAAVVTRFMEEIRGSEPSVADAPVRIPGDRAARTRAQRSSQDVPLADEVWKQIQALAEWRPA
ncbi:LDH2 family malate/lactate/ureidoglycolate dehydrogenase [Pseudochelatococcus lubricantis]|uniref:LDH2 family malate/lactate/ureidoglycolate dehydrogenase n=1 Tax=Pseudochelatococcus lubricantis TaxID=1538102 RepID=A0ABX0V6H9_9HYPH|nr:Ldh family oxidoreductase [Pseudochelatococcus lubricantis]NIJ60089.1 LDH2 family malate/lactate/ureidoglycolate dehydrogenase [Pseudochelatococcus lubricantis]